MSRVAARAAGETEFLQAVRHVARDVITIEKADPVLTAAKVLERLSEPDRIVGFRIVWQDDTGDIQINRGWRVQYCNAVGPYKGGLRFHPTVTPSVLKFLAFEQTFKNALTGLALGGGKGGADFDPSGRSDAEIMRFCQAFMRELAHFIGPDRDVPAGDINVGTREIGWLFGAYKKQALEFSGALTGKGLSFGGSQLRVQATGFGLIYFTQAMLADQGRELEGKRVAISGKGNVATHAALKAASLGARVITLSDTSGCLIADDGLPLEAIEWVQSQKRAGEDIAGPPSRFGARYEAGAIPWEQDCDVALPCATQNELDADMARVLVDSGTMLIAEGANMPLTADAADVIRDAGLAHAPGKASNAGGVAVSGLEMSQNSDGRFCTADEVDQSLRRIMCDLHDSVADEGRAEGRIDYVRGANIAGYRKVASAVAAMGAV